MKLFNFIYEWRRRRHIRREQELRERCIRYAKDSNCIEASSIYRFIVRGSHVERDPRTGENKEYVYSNLEGIIHQDESPTR